MICQACGVEAATKYVSFHENIGLFVLRFSRCMEGNLCKNCIHKHFWRMTGTTAVVGWWGLISLIVTPFFLLNNIGRYALCLRMPPVDPDAAPPTLTQAAFDAIDPHAAELFAMLNEGEKLEIVVRATAETAKVSPAQVMLYLQVVLEASRAHAERPEAPPMPMKLSASDFPNLNVKRDPNTRRDGD